MRRVRLLVLAGSVIGLSLPALGAHAATAPAVPLRAQIALAKAARGLAFIPTRIPSGYRFQSYRLGQSPSTVVLRFARTKPAGSRPAWFTVTTRRFSGSRAACADRRLQTLQMGGNKVYWDGTTAWRCQAVPGGLVRVNVTGPAVDPQRFAAAFAYGRVAASAKRVVERP